MSGTDTCRTIVFRAPALVRVRGREPLTERGREALSALVDAVIAEQRVVHLRPSRPRRTRTVATLWAWAALGLPCRAPADSSRCGACPPCQARTEALRTWCP
jgi:hypothetical protein